MLIDAADARFSTPADIRENIAVVLHKPLVSDATVFENTAYGRAGTSQADVQAAARAADPHDVIGSPPNEYEIRGVQRGRRLSGGQRRRVAVARAMVRDAPVRARRADDRARRAERRRSLEPMRRLMAGRATIVVAHDLLTVREATVS